jgi:hypothetical protein
MPPPIASRSSGGIDFGGGHFSQSKVASTSGLCLLNPPYTAESLTTTSPPITPNTTAAQEHRRAQRPRLPIRLVRRGLVLVEAQQVEREQDRQKRCLRRKERLQAEPVSGQIMLQLLNPLLHAGPPVVITPQ